MDTTGRPFDTTGRRGYSFVMHSIAAQLNAVLDNTTAGVFLSAFGRRIYFPKGIVAQSQEAAAAAHRFNATAGVAKEEGRYVRLTEIEKQLPRLSPDESVGYAPTAGDPQLRRVWRREMLRKNPGLREESFSLPAVVPGITAGISLIADLMLEAGDAVVLPDLYWSNYDLIFQVKREAEVFTYPLFTPENTFNVDGALQCAKTAAETHSGKVCVVLNFPNNPTGYAPSNAETARLSDGLTRLADSGIRILALCDDAYFGLCYEPDRYFQSLFASLYDRHPHILAVKADGATKEEFAWGFRIGFLTFGCPAFDRKVYDALEQKLKGAIRAAVSSSSRPAQSLLLSAMKDPAYQKDKTRRIEQLRARYQMVKTILERTRLPDGLKILPFNSGYFMSFELTGDRAETIRKILLEREGTGVIALHDRYLRIAYSSVEEQQLEALFQVIIDAAR